VPHDAEGSGKLEEETRVRFIEFEKSDLLDP